MRPTRILLTGADGMLGRALTAALAASPATRDWPLLGVSLADFDIADREALDTCVDAFGPDVVIHTAALAVVDTCETSPKTAMRVNTEGLRNIAAACRRHGARLLSLSSDYVFDGLGAPAGGYREEDLPNPLSVYGLTKVAGERICSLVPGHLSIRTSWLFGGTDEGVDVVLAAVRQLRRGEAPRLIHDQFSLPTYTADLADALVFLLTRETPVTGTVHIANSGTASWYEVGREIRAVLGTGPQPLPLPMAECGFIGGRPVDSTLSTARLAGLGLVLPHWRDALHRFLADLPADAPEDAVR
ncbi:dTDP-4-dehydrorhamnose reductase [Streptomyces sp. E-08]|uniref:dTDP-4-dehydrorhamnose reductase n=1 Tax=Streptomyces sp. E-08 TaxID=3404047 RepID=UPI003CEB054E